MTALIVSSYDSLVTDPQHLPKALGKQYLRAFAKMLGPKFKANVVKSETTVPRSWDYGNYTLLEITPPKVEGLPEKPIKVAITLYIGDNFASGVASMDSPYGSIPAPRGEPERVVISLVEAVASKLKSVFKMAFSYDRRLLAHKALFDRSFYLPKQVRGTPPNVDTQGTDLDIWTYEAETAKGPMPMAIAFQGKSQKPIWHFSFHSEENREKRIESTISARKRELESKQQKLEDRRNFQHGLEVGTILYASWGYDQTNVDFYEVTGLKGKQVILREIGVKVVQDDGHSERVVAIPGQFIGPSMVKLPTGLGGGVSVKINSVIRATPWDGKPKYRTGLYAGH